MSMISVGGNLVNQWTILVAVLQGEFGGFSDSEDVHAIDLETRDIVSSLVELRRCGMSVRLRSHGVVVVLTHEHDR